MKQRKRGYGKKKREEREITAWRHSYCVGPGWMKVEVEVEVSVLWVEINGEMLHLGGGGAARSCKQDDLCVMPYLMQALPCGGHSE